MPTLLRNVLTDFAAAIFVASNVPNDASLQVAESLVLGNLSGHDSHGVIRIIEYVDWIERGWINPHAELVIERKQPCILILNENFGFGQVIGRQAIQLGIEQAKAEGVCVKRGRIVAHDGFPLGLRDFEFSDVKGFGNVH
jgi:uncharacterized oxidoreductase